METERILLRKIQREDVEDIFEYAVEPDTGPMAGWEPHKNIEETHKIMDIWLNPECREVVYGVVYKPENKVIGTLGVTELNKHVKDKNNVFVNQIIETGKKTYELGCVLGKKYWGKGIATEIIKLIIDYLFENLEADVIICCHYKENIGSKKAQERNNLKVIGEYTRDKKWWITDCDTMVVRAKTREEWQIE